VPTSLTSSSGSRNPQLLPDGRQTRIDFFTSGKRRRTDQHIVVPKKGSFEWWHAVTGWLRPARHEQEHQLEAFRSFLEERNYSKKTCNSYLYMLRKFFAYTDEKKVEELTLGDIEDYNYDFFVSGKYSRSYQLQFINGLTLYLEFAHGVKVNLKGLRRPSVRR
jgi:hypothetical protein